MSTLHRLESLKGFSLQAGDGEIGHLREVWFDDRNWAVRYLVVQTGNWLTGRRVLIAPGTVSAIDTGNQSLAVGLTRRQVRDSPPMESETTVSGRYEAELHRHYGWEPYWLGDPMLMAGIPAEVPEAADEPARQPPESHLRSSEEIRGYHIHARDGEIGHVEDYLVDPQCRTLRYLEIDTRNWLPGKRVLIAPAWVQEIDWPTGTVHVRLERAVIQDAPEYDPSVPFAATDESRLLAYYRAHVNT